MPNKTTLDRAVYYIKVHGQHPIQCFPKERIQALSKRRRALVLWCFIYLHSHRLFLSPHLEIDIHSEIRDHLRLSSGQPNSAGRYFPMFSAPFHRRRGAAPPPFGPASRRRPILQSWPPPAQNTSSNRLRAPEKFFTGGVRLWCFGALY